MFYNWGHFYGYLLINYQSEHIAHLFTKSEYKLCRRGPNWSDWLITCGIFPIPQHSPRPNSFANHVIRLNMEFGECVHKMMNYPVKGGGGLKLENNHWFIIYLPQPLFIISFFIIFKAEWRRKPLRWRVKIPYCRL